MELMQLRYVSTLAECFNYTKAAEQLFISQPALSQQISKLEHEFGFPVFERSTKMVSLTPEGDIILPNIRKILAEVNELSSRVANINPSASGDVYLGINLMDRSAIPRTISSFVETYPSVHLQIHEEWSERLIEMVKNGALDGAIIAHPVGDGLECAYDIPGIQAFTLSTDYLVLAVGLNHKLVGRSHISLESIVAETIIFPSKHSNVSVQVLKCFEKLGISPRRVIMLDSSPSLIDFVFSGAGVAFISSQHAKKYEGRQTLVSIPIYPPLDRRSAFIVSAERELKPAAKLVQEYLVSKLCTKDKAAAP